MDASATGNSNLAVSGDDYKAAPDPIPADQISEIIDADVVVVGLGNAGTFAALTAAEEGARVVVLQKGEGVYCNGTASSWPKSTVLDADGHNFDAWQIVNDVQRGLNCNRGDTKLWRNWVRYGEEIANWWIPKANAHEDVGPVLGEVALFGPNAAQADDDNKFNEYYLTAHVPMGASMSGNQPTQMVNTALLEDALADGADINVLDKTPAVQLVTSENGAVTGAIGQRETGEYVRVNAERGVILCTGGYANNPQMRHEYCEHLDVIPAAQAEKYDTGDGILMGLWAGGAIQPGPHCGAVHYDPGIGVPNYLGAVVPWLRVNVEGERFCNEDMGYALISMQDIQQPEAIHFQVFDDNYATDIDFMGQGTQFGVWKDFIPQALEAGDLCVGNTVEELAESMGVPADALSATVNRYNELAEAGYDEDFGKQKSRLKPIVKAPFYALKRRPSVLATMNGLLVDEDYRVLNENRVPIEGLFATGNDSGGMFGGIQYPMNIPGISVGRALMSGRIAAWRAMGK